MSQPLHNEPTDAVLEGIGASTDDSPFVALNLNRYRQHAAYPAGTPDAGVSGREAYLRYGMVAMQAIVHVGGRVLWLADSREVVIGCEHDTYDEVVAVWYPSRTAFVSLMTYPGYREAFEVHRRAAVEHAALLFFEAGAEPKLRAP